MRTAGLMVLALLAGGCDDQRCITEDVQVRAEGTCFGAAQDLTIHAFGCRITTAGAGSLPAAGAAYDGLARIRDGGWALYGDTCPANDPRCATPQFRLCRARRVEWRLELDCVDGSGAPVCQATLTE
jgi:hypothetical protein